MTNACEDDTVERVSLAEEYSHVVKALEDIETFERLRHHPSLTERAPDMEADDLKEQQEQQKRPQKELTEGSDAADGSPMVAMATISEDGTEASLKRRHLKNFSVSQIQVGYTIMPNKNPSWSYLNLTCLDVSQNELMELPGLSSLSNLVTLNLNRNWFGSLPSEIGSLKGLRHLIASRNFLRPNATSLRWDELKQLNHLSTLDLRYNQKCGRPLHRDRVQNELASSVEILMTLWEEIGSNPGTYVGLCAADRNPELLRSQLEPLKTPALRRRLVRDFGQLPTDPTNVDRAGVMKLLLQAYETEGMCHGSSSSQGGADSHDEWIGNRTQLYLDGTPVPQVKIDALMVELRKWTATTGLLNKNRERPSIQAKNYMILRKPKPPQHHGENDDALTASSRRAIRKEKKMEQYRTIWELGMEALRDVDPVFANERCTEMAVTYGFRGSPHLDKQNCGPFYGLSMGNFAHQTGGICVESSARVVVHVDTKHKLAKIDGRYVHWVAPYDNNNDEPVNETKTNDDDGHTVANQQPVERYSLIYYETGNDFVNPGPAVFSIPTPTKTDTDTEESLKVLKI